MLALPLTGSTPELYHGKYVAGMYGSGEQGVWYEPSLSNGTLFQDAAGTTPVTAVEQPVGLMLDKRKGLIGQVGKGSYNLLTYSHDYANAAWLNSQLIIQPNSAIAPTGDVASKLVPTVFNSSHVIRRNSHSYQSGYVYRFIAKASGYDYVAVLSGDAQAYTFFNISNGTIGTVSPWHSNPTIVPLGDGWFECSVTYNQGNGVTATRIQVTPANDIVIFAGNGTSGIYLAGVDFRPVAYSNLEPRVQKITSAGSWLAAIPGNHAKQTTSADRPVFSARYNLLTKTEQFDNAVWVKDNLAVTAKSIIAPDGTLTAYKYTPNAGTTGYNNYAIQSVNFTGSGVITIFAKAAEYRYVRLSAGSFHLGRVAIFDLVAGTVTETSSDTNTTETITALGDGWYRLTLTSTGITPSLTVVITVQTAGTGSGIGADGTSGIYIWGASLVPANQAQFPYQRVNTATDYDADPVKFPPYLKFNGTNSWMVTPSIDFTGTDKMTVWAGVRKLSDAAAGAIVELSATPTAADQTARFGVTASHANLASYGFGMTTNSGASGTLQVRALTYTAPITNVVSANFDSSLASGSGRAVPRINAAAPGSIEISFEQPGTSPVKFGAFPIYIGRRGGVTLPFNGNLYSLIIRGAATDDAHLTHAEKLVGYKTGVSL